MKTISIVRTGVCFSVLLVVNFISWGDAWYCNECDAIHNTVCPKMLFDSVDYDLTERQIDLLEKIQSAMEDLDAKSRVVVILRLIYSHVSAFSVTGPNMVRNIINWEVLKSFSWSLWEEIYQKEEHLNQQRREYSDTIGILEDLQRLKPYLDTEPHYVSFNMIDFKNKVQEYLKGIAQKCCLRDLEHVKNDLEKYGGSKHDTIRIIQIIENVLTPLNCSEDVGMGCFSPIGFLEIAKEVFSVQYTEAEMLYKHIELLQGPPMDESNPWKIIDLAYRLGNTEKQIENVRNDVESLLKETKCLLITDIIERLMERYAFSFGAITPCYFLCYWIGKEYEKELEFELFPKKLK